MRVDATPRLSQPLPVPLVSQLPDLHTKVLWHWGGSVCQTRIGSPTATQLGWSSPPTPSSRAPRVPEPAWQPWPREWPRRARMRSTRSAGVRWSPKLSPGHPSCLLDMPRAGGQDMLPASGAAPEPQGLVHAGGPRQHPGKRAGSLRAHRSFPPRFTGVKLVMVQITALPGPGP